MTNEQLLILDTLRGAEELPSLYKRNEFLKKLDILNNFLSNRLKEYPDLTDEEIENIYVAIKAYMD
jgi:hypothetical protein